MSLKPQQRRGFTLVELLVVITIIGMLMALLLPAVNASVEAARNLYCKNNSRNLAIAVNAFDAERKRYPGYANGFGGSPPGELGGGWAVAVLPQLDRVDLYDAWMSTTSNTPSTAMRPYLEVMVCPSNPPEQTGASVNSYVINAGHSSTETAFEIPPNGIAHDYRRRRVFTTSENVLDGLAQTLVISENVQAKNWELFDKISNVMVWNPTFSTSALGKINGRGTYRSLRDVPLNVETARPSSFHSGGVNAAFADTHVVFLREDIDYRVYMQLMTPHGKESHMPADAKTYILNEADFR